jgi:hypothetical protein
MKMVNGLPQHDGLYWLDEGRGWILVDVRTTQSGRQVFPQGKNIAISNVVGNWYHTAVLCDGCQKQYSVSMEIFGPKAHFGDPDGCGTAPSTYVAPTWSISKGILEAIGGLRCRDNVFVCPTSVEILAPIETTYHTMNYGGPARDARQIVNNHMFQFSAQFLRNPKYRIHAQIIRMPHYQPNWQHSNEVHAYQEILKRSIAGQKCSQHPCLGTTDCQAEWWGNITEDRPIDYNCPIPVMIFSIYDRPLYGQKAQFKPCMRNTEIHHGVLQYAWSFDPMS